MIAKEVIGWAGAGEQQANTHTHKDIFTIGSWRRWRGFTPIKQEWKIKQDICICSIQVESIFIEFMNEQDIFSPK